MSVHRSSPLAHVPPSTKVEPVAEGPRQSGGGGRRADGAQMKGPGGHDRPKGPRSKGPNGRRSANGRGSSAWRARSATTHSKDGPEGRCHAAPRRFRASESSRTSASGCSKRWCRRSASGGWSPPRSPISSPAPASRGGPSTNTSTTRRTACWRPTTRSSRPRSAAARPRGLGCRVAASSWRGSSARCSTRSPSAPTRRA